MFGSMHSSASADFYTTRRRIKRPSRPSNSEYPASPRVERHLISYCDAAQDGERNQEVFNDLLQDLQCVVHKSYGKQVNEYQVKCQCLEEEMVELKEELVEVEENKFAIANELMKAAADAQTAQEAYGDETRRRCILETVVTEQKASINRLNSLLEVDTKEKDHLLECIKDLEEQLKESQEIMDDLQNQVQELEDCCVEHKEVEETQKIEIVTHEEKCCSLVEALAKCCEDNDEFQSEIAELKDQIEKMKCVIEGFDNDRKCIIEEFMKERECCELEKTKLENCIMQLKKSLEDVLGQKNDICRKMNSVVSAHHSEMDCLRKEKEKLSLLNTSQKLDLEKLKRAHKDCQTEKRELKSEIKRLQKENAIQRQNLGEQENLISELSDKLNDQSHQKEMAKRQLFNGSNGLTKMTCSEIIDRFMPDKLPLRKCDDTLVNGQKNTRKSQQNDQETSVQNQNPGKNRKNSSGVGQNQNLDKDQNQDQDKRDVGKKSKPKKYEEETKTKVKVEVTTTEDENDESTLEDSEKVKMIQQLEQKVIQMASEKRVLEEKNQKLKENLSQNNENKDQDKEYQINYLTDMNNNLKTSLAQLQKKDQSTTIISPEKLEKLETKVAQLQIQLDESFGEKKSLEMNLRNLGQEKSQLVLTIQKLEEEMSKNLDRKSSSSINLSDWSLVTNLQTQLEKSQMKLKRLNDEMRDLYQVNSKLESNIEKEKLSKDMVQKELDEYHQFLEKSLQIKAQLIEKISYYEQILENQKDSSKYTCEDLSKLKEKYRQLKIDFKELQEYLEKILHKLEYYKGKYRSLRGQVQGDEKSLKLNQNHFKILQDQKSQYQKLVEELQNDKNLLQEEVDQLAEHKAILEHEMKRVIAMLKANYVERKFYEKVVKEKEQIELELLALRTAVNGKSDSCISYRYNLAKLKKLHKEVNDFDGQNTSADEYDEITDQTFNQLATAVTLKNPGQKIQENDDDDKSAILKIECSNLAQDVAKDVQNDIKDLRKIIMSRDDEIKSLKSSLGHLKGRQELEAEARVELFSKLQGLVKNPDKNYDYDRNNNQ